MLTEPPEINFSGILLKVQKVVVCEMRVFYKVAAI